MKYNLIFDYHKKGKSCFIPYDIEGIDLSDYRISDELKRDDLHLVEVSERELISHYIKLSKENFGVDDGFYPLGSCTMKYNPKINEKIAKLEGFINLHPFSDIEDMQGILEILYQLQNYLSEITGMSHFSLQPAAGAHGELTAMYIIKKYLKDKGKGFKDVVLVPDSAHGTNPASASMAGFKVVEVKSDNLGQIDLLDLEKKLNENVAALMLTNPNTLGLFDRNIIKIAEMIHKKGGLLYYDGANLNANLSIARPGDLGFDLLHLNLHKTFSSPHGGGGPGAGPVGVKEFLKDYLPIPVIDKNQKNLYFLNYNLSKSIGMMKSFYGNISPLIKAWVYIRMLSSKGLKKTSQIAVLNANYLKEKLKNRWQIAFDRICQHEFVISVEDKKVKNHILALDVAKRLIDYGIHPPTIYFPLMVKEALMIEPTETESLDSLNYFIEVMNKIADEIENEPEKLKKAPLTTNFSRFDEVSAARKPILNFYRIKL